VGRACYFAAQIGDAVRVAHGAAALHFQPARQCMTQLWKVVKVASYGGLWVVCRRVCAQPYTLSGT
jgi:hypothetical protein